METKITKIGNSQGIIIPKTILEQCGLTDKVSLEVKDNHLIVSQIVVNPRQGWEEAIIAAGVDEDEDEELLMGDYLEHSWDEEEWTW